MRAIHSTANRRGPSETGPEVGRNSGPCPVIPGLFSKIKPDTFAHPFVVGQTRGSGPARKKIWRPASMIESASRCSVPPDYRRRAADAECTDDLARSALKAVGEWEAHRLHQLMDKKNGKRPRRSHERPLRPAGV